MKKFKKTRAEYDPETGIAHVRGRKKSLKESIKIWNKELGDNMENESYMKLILKYILENKRKENAKILIEVFRSEDVDHLFTSVVLTKNECVYKLVSSNRYFYNDDLCECIEKDNHIKDSNLLDIIRGVKSGKKIKELLIQHSDYVNVFRHYMSNFYYKFPNDINGFSVEDFPLYKTKRQSFYRESDEGYVKEKVNLENDTKMYSIVANIRKKRKQGKAGATRYEGDPVKAKKDIRDPLEGKGKISKINRNLAKQVKNTKADYVRMTIDDEPTKARVKVVDPLGNATTSDVSSLISNMRQSITSRRR